MAQRQLSRASDGLTKVFQRLASGQRINSASDDPASFAVSQVLKSDARLSQVAQRNLNDGISLLNMADAALTSMKDIATGMIELAEQSSNGTLTLAQRRALDQEGEALADEYNRIVQTTSFNGRALFSGGNTNITLQAGTSGLTHWTLLNYIGRRTISSRR